MAGLKQQTACSDKAPVPLDTDGNAYDGEVAPSRSSVYTIYQGTWHTVWLGIYQVPGMLYQSQRFRTYGKLLEAVHSGSMKVVGPHLYPLQGAQRVGAPAAYPHVALCTRHPGQNPPPVVRASAAANPGKQTSVSCVHIFAINPMRPACGSLFPPGRVGRRDLWHLQHECAGGGHGQAYGERGNRSQRARHRPVVVFVAVFVDGDGGRRGEGVEYCLIMLLFLSRWVQRL